MVKKYKVLDLFSGLGGFSLGLERTGHFETVAFCDNDKFSKAILDKHWKGIKVYDDVREITKEKFKEGHVLKLNRSVYGLKQSPKNFFELLKTNLESCGLKQSRLDPCLFIGPRVICVCYVDDCLFFAPSEMDIDDCITSIKNCGMDLQVEDSVAGFLGVHIERKPAIDADGNKVEEIHLLQSNRFD